MAGSEYFPYSYWNKVEFRIFCIPVFYFFFTSVAHVVCELTKWKKVQSLHGN